MRIQLLSHPGCPNASATREQLLRALGLAGLAAEIEEIDTMSEATPEQLRGWGSPTVLIDGEDLVGESPSGRASCRLYRGGDGESSGAPTVSLLVTVLRHCAG